MTEQHKEQDSMKDKNKDTKILNKHNLLVKTRYHLNTVEMKTYLFLLYKAQSLSRYRKDEILVESEFVSFYMSREEFRHIRDGKQVLEKARLEKVLDGLMTKPIYWEDPNDTKRKWSKFCFIGKQVYDFTNDRFKILLPIEVYRMLTKYLEDGYGYTPENLSLLLSAKCTYTYRLYELLRLWSNSRIDIEYSLEELKDLFMLEDKKSYSTYFNFKSKVILPAKNELEELNLFEIDFKENKKGKKVESITFSVKDLDTRKYFDKKDAIDIIEYKNTENNDTVEPLQVENNIKSLPQQKEVLKMEINEFHIPDESIFSKGALVLFKRNFKDYDFSKDFLEDIFYEGYAITVDRDSVDVIDTKSYKFFKQTLENKINDYFSKEVKKTAYNKIGAEYKKTNFHNFSETFTQYTPEELDEIIEKSQREKYK